jgi:hypothetical protein
VHNTVVICNYVLLLLLLLLSSSSSLSDIQENALILGTDLRHKYLISQEIPDAVGIVFELLMMGGGTA